MHLTGQPLCNYWDVGDYLIANNHKVGTQSIYSALMTRDGKVVCRLKATKDVRLLVRDPVERFISALATLARQFNRFLDPDEILMTKPDDPHLWPQVKWLARSHGTCLYRFPEHLGQFAADCQLGALSWMHRSPWVPVLDEAQKERVRQAYRQDVRLFESIRKPRQTI